MFSPCSIIAHTLYQHCYHHIDINLLPSAILKEERNVKNFGTESQSHVLKSAHQHHTRFRVHI